MCIRDRDNPVTWSANATAISFNFTGTEFNLNGGEKICDAVPGTWYKIVLSADVTSKLCFAKVYDAEGTLLEMCIRDRRRCVN